MAQWGNTFAAQYRCFLAEAFHSGGRALPHRSWTTRWWTYRWSWVGPYPRGSPSRPVGIKKGQHQHRSYPKSDHHHHHHHQSEPKVYRRGMTSSGQQFPGMSSSGQQFPTVPDIRHSSAKKCMRCGVPNVGKSQDPNVW